MSEKEYQSVSFFLPLCQGGWESINGNPDIFIFQGYDSKYYLLAYIYDKDYGRGSFSCYEIELDENEAFVYIGTKRCSLKSEEAPHTLYITDWGSYMKN